MGKAASNKSLQRTFDPPPIFADAKKAVPQMPLNSGVKAVDKPTNFIGLRLFDRPLITRLGHAV
jgi:hypothetical protein